MLSLQHRILPDNNTLPSSYYAAMIMIELLSYFYLQCYLLYVIPLQVLTFQSFTKWFIFRFLPEGEKLRHDKTNFPVKAQEVGEAPLKQRFKTSCEVRQCVDTLKETFVRFYFLYFIYT